MSLLCVCRISFRQFSPVEPAAPSPIRRVPFLFCGLLLACFIAVSNNPVLANTRDLDQKVSTLLYRDFQAQLSQTSLQKPVAVQVYFHAPEPYAVHDVLLSFNYNNTQQSISLQASVDMPRWFVAELPAALDAGEYDGFIQLQQSTEQGNEKRVEWPLKLKLGSGRQLIQWQIQPTFIGSDKLLTRYWGEVSQSWPGILVGLFLPGRAEHHKYNENIHLRPDYRLALQACADGNTHALVDLTLILEQQPVQSEWGEDLLACALNSGQRQLAHELIGLWREQGGLSIKAQSMALDLAQMELAHQQLEKAEALLIQAAEGEFTSPNNTRWRDLASRILMRKGDLQGAVELLRQGLHRQAEAALVGDPEQQLLYQTMRLNLAVALKQTGEQAVSVSLLDDIGQVTPTSQAMAALADQANVLLGWHFLEDGQGLTAQAAFNRVRLQGSSATIALLGRGYALAGAAGQVQARSPSEAAHKASFHGESIAKLKAKFNNGFISCEQFRAASGDHTVCARSRAFTVADVQLDANQRRQKALLTWLHLSQRGLPDIASQEARLRAATLLHKQQRYAEALELLETALQLLENQRAKWGQERTWLKKNMPKIIASQADSDSFWASLPWTDASKTVLAKWLAGAEVEALISLHKQAQTLQRNDLAAEAMRLLNASLLAEHKQHTQHWLRMEPEIRMRLARIYHQQVMHNQLEH